MVYQLLEKGCSTPFRLIPINIGPGMITGFLTLLTFYSATTTTLSLQVRVSFFSVPQYMIPLSSIGQERRKLS
jgi:hypothetical protein